MLQALKSDDIVLRVSIPVKSPMQCGDCIEGVYPVTSPVKCGDCIESVYPCYKP